MSGKSKLVLLLLAGIGIGLIFAELIARYTFPSPGVKFSRYMESERGKFARYDQMLGWDGLANAENDFNWADTSHHVRQNRFGYRGNEYGYERTGKRRMVVLGDSFVWGFGVENKDIFTGVMEEKAGGSVEIINMGVSGYGTDQEYLLWKGKGHLWQPDDVILIITINSDVLDNISPFFDVYPKPLFIMDEKGELTLSNVPVPRNDMLWHKTKGSDPVSSERNLLIHKIIRKSTFANLIFNALLKNNSVRSFMESKYLIPPRRLGFIGEHMIYVTPADEDAEKAWMVMFKIIEKLNSETSEKGARLTVVIIPSILQVYPELWAMFTNNFQLEEGMSMAPETPNARLSAWCKQNSIPIIDLLPELKKAGGSNPFLYYPINLHWTRDGHEAAAGILFRELGLKNKR